MKLKSQMRVIYDELLNEWLTHDSENLNSDRAWALTMAQCTWTHTSHLPAPGSCGSALPGSGTGFCRWAARRCTSLWDTEPPDESPGPRPGAGHQLDSQRSAAALWKNVDEVWALFTVHELYWPAIKAFKPSTSGQHSSATVKLWSNFMSCIKL